MAVIPGARARAREEVFEAIRTQARHQLATGGAATLSVRALTRELGMSPSALYRYFPSRHALLTALIVDAFDAVGRAAETALHKSGTGDPVRSWVSVCRAVRRWALEHPHEYALVYGSPVPGYQAPQDTVGPASRVARTLLSLAGSAQAAGALEASAHGESSALTLGPQLLQLTEQQVRSVPAAALTRLISSWAQLFGLISFEIFGHHRHVVPEVRDELFDEAVTALAFYTGLRTTGDAGRS